MRMKEVLFIRAFWSLRPVPAKIATVALATLLLLSSNAAGLAQAATANTFTVAGFVARAANTPDKLRRLKSFPPYRFVTRRSANGVYYVYADPELCVCAYVGTQQALDSYRRLMAQGAGAPAPGGDMSTVESQMIDGMDRDGVETPFDDDSLF